MIGRTDGQLAQFLSKLNTAPHLQEGVAGSSPASGTLTDIPLWFPLSTSLAERGCGFESCIWHAN